jgi:hypothetical protein
MASKGGRAIRMAAGFRKALSVAAVAATLTVGPWIVFGQEPGRDLHELAVRKGGKAVVRFSPDRAVRYPNIEELARRSDLVVVARTLHNRSRLRPDGKFISEVLWVRVQEVIKGNLTNAVKIPVVVPGGLWRFQDGSVVMLEPKESIRPENGGSYVFFLGKQSAVYKGREVVGGFQGVFDLTGGIVTPADQAGEDPVVEKYSGMSAGKFLAKLQTVVGRNVQALPNRSASAALSNPRTARAYNPRRLAR